MSTTHRVRVAGKWAEAEGIAGLELVDAAGNGLPPYTPGSHIDVHVPGGLVRQYSLARPYQHDAGYQIAVLREPRSRGGSEALCAVSAGEALTISAPRNHFPLAGGDYSILLAGGIGITPILCMAEHLAAQGAAFELHYCARSTARMAFRGRIQASAYADRTRWHLDHGDDSQKLDAPAVLAAPQPGRHLYVCGPPGFLDHVRTSAGTAGWADVNIHFEYFSPPADTVAAPAGSFEVVIASSGQSVTVGGNETVIQALARIGIDVPVSCEQGVCGSCLTPVIEGVPDHRDYLLTDGERARNDQFLPCCSRSLSSRLVLDL